jgi:hypothetical protein
MVACSALSLLANSAGARKTLTRWAGGEAPIYAMRGSVRSTGYLRLCVASYGPFPLGA